MTGQYPQTFALADGRYDAGENAVGLCRDMDAATIHSYTAYGLGIHSPLPLPELVVSEAEAEVAVRAGRLELPPSTPTSTGCSFSFAQGKIYLFWEKVGKFLVQDGHEIIMDPIPGIEDSVLRLFLLGPVLGVLLQQRGLLVLHGSAVAVNGSAVAFIGNKGFGKSTTAAALCSRGHAFVADDIVALEIRDAEGPRVLPGFPQLKLWPEAVASLGDDPEALPPIRPEIEKRARHVTTRFSQSPIPLCCIYVLSGGATLEIDPTQAQATFVELVRHLYVSRFGSSFLQAIGASSLFFQCAALAKRIPLRYLKRPYDLSALSEVAQLVEHDLVELAGHKPATLPRG